MVSEIFLLESPEMCAGTLTTTRSRTQNQTQSLSQNFSSSLTNSLSLFLSQTNDNTTNTSHTTNKACKTEAADPAPGKAPHSRASLGPSAALSQKRHRSKSSTSSKSSPSAKLIKPSPAVSPQALKINSSDDEKSLHPDDSAELNRDENDFWRKLTSQLKEKERDPPSQTNPLFASLLPFSTSFSQPATTESSTAAGQKLKKNSK